MKPTSGTTPDFQSSQRLGDLSVGSFSFQGVVSRLFPVAAVRSCHGVPRIVWLPCTEWRKEWRKGNSSGRTNGAKGIGRQVAVSGNSREVPMPNRKAPLSAKDIDEFRPPQYPYRLGCGNGLYLYYQHSMTSWQVRVRMPGVNT